MHVQLCRHEMCGATSISQPMAACVPFSARVGQRGVVPLGRRLHCAVWKRDQLGNAAATPLVTRGTCRHKTPGERAEVDQPFCQTSNVSCCVIFIEVRTRSRTKRIASRRPTRPAGSPCGGHQDGLGKQPSRSW